MVHKLGGAARLNINDAWFCTGLGTTGFYDVCSICGFYDSNKKKSEKTVTLVSSEGAR